MVAAVAIRTIIPGSNIIVMDTLLNQKEKRGHLVGEQQKQGTRTSSVQRPRYSHLEKLFCELKLQGVAGHP
jgi:hypothetical protein